MRLGIVSDIHGQPRALRQAIGAMGDIDRLVSLGDSISQGHFCNETVGLLRQREAIVILGNHEEAFLGGTGRGALGVDMKLVDWLERQPPRIEIELGGRRLLLVHSTPWASDHAYVTPSHRDFARFSRRGVDLLLYGHTHQPVIQLAGATLVVNPGSTGEGRATDQGFVRSCALVDLATLSATIIDLPD